MKTQQNNFRLIALLGMVLFAVVARVALPTFFPQYGNFAPIGAMALFGGAYFAGRMRAVVVTMLAVWAGDLFLNYMYFHRLVFFYDGFYWQYASYAAIVAIGGLLTGRVTPLAVVEASIGCSIVFFLLSNFGVWAGTGMYPHTAAGLILCYAMGLPFVRETFLSDIFYSAILFGAFEFALQRFPTLAKKRLRAANL